LPCKISWVKQKTNLLKQYVKEQISINLKYQKLLNNEFKTIDNKFKSSI
jgi:hypothetical protein